MNKQEIEKAVSFINNVDLSIFTDKEKASHMVELITEILHNSN